MRACHIREVSLTPPAVSTLFKMFVCRLTTRAHKVAQMLKLPFHTVRDAFSAISLGVGFAGS
jgi:hypothetical protein